MVLQMSSTAAAKTRHPINVHGSTYQITDYVGRAPKHGGYFAGNEANANPLPQGFLVEQPPGSATPPHFHETNQFQVVVGGTGWIGKHGGAPLQVHYVNGHTPYGPVTAGQEGLYYFTLRAAWDPGAKYLPESVERLKKGNQRTRIAEAPVDTAEALAARTATEVETVMAPEPDGLAAWLWRVGPSTEVTLPDPAGSGGQYHVVAAGAAVREGETLDLWSTLFVMPDDAPLTLKSGATGLDLLVLQFPKA